ncbi:MAG: redox-regulated ATPase YchF [Defluviitaleaceae bacterium]|nr:redox-regulated ATPase YchF [Defluviitaleaceae bacterium]
MKIGILGVPNCGKTALFNACTKSGAKSGVSPFSTKESNVGQVKVPEPRLFRLAEMHKSEKVIHATTELMDIAGLVRGSGKGEGLGNKFLASIRESDALLHVVRCFEDENVMHVDGNIDPVRDIETIDFELIFADLEQLERRKERTQKAAKADKNLAAELIILDKFIEALEAGTSLRDVELTKEEDDMAAMFGLLSKKTVIYALNVDDNSLDSGNTHSRAAMEVLRDRNAEVFLVSAKLEEEMVDFDDEERDAMLADLGISVPGSTLVISAGFKALGLMCFLTAGPKESRAWTIPLNTKAKAAAGKIHSDIERGFIRAEVVNFADLEEYGSPQGAKEAGKVRLEGKEYIVKDGDVILFRFNV